MTTCDMSDVSATAPMSQAPSLTPPASQETIVLEQHTGQVPHLAPLCIPWALSPSPTVLAQPRRASHRAWHSSDTLLEGGTRAVRALRGTIVGAVGSMLAAVAQRQAGARLAVQAKLGRGWATVLSKVLCAVH